MSEPPVVVVHTADGQLARELAAHLPGVGLLHTAGGDDLGRVLTSGRPVALLIAHVEGPGDRGWIRLEMISGTLPDLPIIAYLDRTADPWDPKRGHSPVTSVVRAPIAPAELAR